LGTGRPSSFARDRVDAPARQAERDDERRDGGDEPAPVEGGVRADLVDDRRRRARDRRRRLHDRRRLPQDARDERGGGRQGIRLVGKRGRACPWKRTGMRAERDRRLDGVAANLRPERKEAIDQRGGLRRRGRGDGRKGRGGLVGSPEAGGEPVLALERHPPGEQSEERTQPSA
jgi:hypothetical protein